MTSPQDVIHLARLGTAPPDWRVFTKRRGVVGAFFATRFIRGLLFRVTPNDPTTFIGVAVMMAAIGIVACWIPALRAARIDPAITMRST